MSAWTRRVALFAVFLLWCIAGSVRAQTGPRHHVVAIEGGDWSTWRGHDGAYLTAHLGDPDRRRGPSWHYDYVTVGSFDGPYRIWRLTFVFRDGRIASVRAEYVAGVGCDLYE